MVGDFLLDEALDQLAEYFLLAGGERFDLIDRAVPGEPFQDHFGDRAAERRRAMHDLADAGEDFVRIGGFQEVS